MMMMKLQKLILALGGSFLLLTNHPHSAAASSGEQCGGGAPMKNITTFLNMSLEYDLADFICCNNHRYAEDQGYLTWPEINLFGRLDPQAEDFVFYDSVCNIPLFIVPRGRSFDEFKEESIHHGWPSFRPAEMISEHVILHDNGRMESICGTHLGHNLPSNGIDRYCIDLVCIAGTPTPGNEFDSSSYTSSAVEFSGKYNSTTKTLLMIAAVGGGVLILVGILVYVRRLNTNNKETTNNANKQATKTSSEEDETASFSEGKQQQQQRDDSL